MFDRVSGKANSLFCQDLCTLLYSEYWPFSAIYSGLMYAKLVNTQGRHSTYQIRFSRLQLVRLFTPIFPTPSVFGHNKAPYIALDPHHV